jgi:hypothetical protein
MSIREKLAGLGSAVKEKVGAAFGDPDQQAAERELEAELGLAHQERAASSTAPPTPPMDETTARRVLGLSDDATLDEVRAAAASLARPALAGAAANDDSAAGALERIAAAAELLEERLLPLAGTPIARTGAAPPTAPHPGGRFVATAGSPR